jgi:hypothetical protein
VASRQRIVFRQRRAKIALRKFNDEEACTFHQEMPKLTPGALRPEFERSIFDAIANAS